MYLSMPCRHIYLAFYRHSDSSSPTLPKSRKDPMQTLYILIIIFLFIYNMNIRTHNLLQMLCTACIDLKTTRIKLVTLPPWAKALLIMLIGAISKVNSKITKK